VSSSTTFTTSAGLRARMAGTRLGRHLATKIFQPRGSEAGEVFLNQRRVFILPTRAGLMLALMLVALLLGSINYSLSLGFALTFLVVGVAWIGMLLTFRNLAHLRLRPLRVDPVFAGQPADYRLVVRNAAAFDRYAIHLTVDGLMQSVPCDPAAGLEEDVTIPVPTTRRGLQAMPRITLATRFPLGLWRAWSYWQPDLAALVYPRPAEPGVPLPFAPGDGREAQAHRVRGSEDFAGLRAYVPGDPVRHIAWRAMARNPEARPLTKLFDGGASGEAWLSLEAALAQAADLEAALSIMARWVLDAEAEAMRYGLALPTVRIRPDRGPAHRAACLKALALV
jgi:uncharacterized protein (DUF58 family)